MTIREKVFEKCIKNPNYSAYSGSLLYGTNTINSDIDIRSWVIPPFEYLLNTKSFDCMELPGDHKVFSLKRFLEMVLQGDPQSSEILFSPKEKIIHCDEIGKEILSLREDIVSMAIYSRILGYSVSEFRKASGTRLVIAERNITEDNVVNDIRTVFSPDKQSMDEILERLMANKERKIIKSQAGVGEKRKGQFEKYGYCVSSAAHSIRLVSQLNLLIRTGEMVFPLQNADLIRDIKQGKHDFKFVTEMYEEEVAKAEEFKEKSVLPYKPNREKVWKTYLKLVSRELLNDSRFLGQIDSDNDPC
jgi:hypothetical protein